ncbi:MAG TPA: response regulator transcription factor [Gaiellales bacterium]|nr:response regulator transcription factor [Gaiellales bacterium]
MQRSARILVVDDDANTRRMLRSYLRNAGFAVAEAGTGDEALQVLQDGGVDAALVDVMLPGIDGLELVRRIRASSAVPIILITARGEEASRVAGLEVGADDYVVKPFFPMELVARVRAHLRRARGSLDDAESTEPLRLGLLEVDLQSRRCTIDGRPIELTRREFDLLVVLLQAPDTVYSRETLLDRAWGTRFLSTKTVDVHIGSLRRKLAEAVRVEALRGVGYRLSEKC